MAVRTKKDKLIEEAQKFALRGQFDKAAKTYEQILAEDPAAVSLRQKLAELLIKCGRNDDARKEFEIIGKHFSKNGFYLKAIAVYKQLQKLFPADISLSLTLAELNEKHGLVANSLSEYKLVYDFHKKTGNTSEALGILDRMQAVAPLNITIKIKLAEAYAQHGKMEESYALFAKTASMLLGHNDNATLSKIYARIQQLFPDKTDFMLEILTEQIRLGNAATAMDSLQSLLRSNPNNKCTWDLIVQAYQQLEQPQRLMIAYQHYLEFFPSEPAAMLGFINSTAASRNSIKALELLDKYESTLISAGFLEQLEQAYNSLAKLDPLNIRALKGLTRIATAAGDESKISSLTSKLESLHPRSGGARPDSAGPEPAPVMAEELPPGANNGEDALFSGEYPSEQQTIPYPESITADPPPEYLPDAGASPLTTDESLPPDEEIEIELDIDSNFGFDDQTAGELQADDNWLDSVGDLFDTINTAPSGVKFGNEMESTDAQSHFDLGQAFKEMGLYDEAINEFRQASKDASRRVECLIMQCACLRERGEVEKAITMLQALLKPGLSNEESCAVKYELASGYEAVGKKEEANLLLSEINASNPGFRDINSRLNAAHFSDSLDFSDDDLKDF